MYTFKIYSKFKFFLSKYTIYINQTIISYKPINCSLRTIVSCELELEIHNYKITYVKTHKG